MDVMTKAYEAVTGSYNTQEANSKSIEAQE